ncbi:hypothetical protein A21D_01243 [Virgibacillus dokdonensis]|uniref:Uncharacterized protein n=1 Tax=Virgibacillus dokdonensis TaxID=302167 RepID=A0A2K9IX75_9BACI|nr:hypothetical protein A21D_01243 [Virgibacillus dokdonensis]
MLKCFLVIISVIEVLVDGKRVVIELNNQVS